MRIRSWPFVIRPYSRLCDAAISAVAATTSPCWQSVFCEVFSMAATTDTTPAANVAQLCEENRVLRAQLESSHRKIEQLSIELEETNKGVLALYAELDDKAQALREASELKSRFLSYMSHEFRTPLGAIRSMARILLDKMDGPLAPEQERQIQFMQQAAVELTELVRYDRHYCGAARYVQTDIDQSRCRVGVRGAGRDAEDIHR